MQLQRFNAWVFLKFQSSMQIGTILKESKDQTYIFQSYQATKYKVRKNVTGSVQNANKKIIKIRAYASAQQMRPCFYHG